MTTVLLALSAQYVEQGLWNGTVSVRLSVPARAHSSKPAAVGPASRRYRSIAAAAACDGRTVRCAIRVKDRLYLTTCASIPLQIRIFYNRDERITDFIQLTVAHITTVILWQDYYIKTHTDSVTYVNANSRPSFFSSSLLFRLYHLCIVHVISSAVCQML